MEEYEEAFHEVVKAGIHEIVSALRAPFDNSH